MFDVRIDLEVVIEGCPENGLGAVDFRRKNGLSEEPHNIMPIKFEGKDEVLCRVFGQYLDKNADLVLKASSCDPHYTTPNAAHKLVSPPHPFRSSTYYGRHAISPSAISTFLADPHNQISVLIEALEEAAEKAEKDVLEKKRVEEEEKAGKVRAALDELQAMDDDSLLKDATYKGEEGFLVLTSNHRFRDLFGGGYPNPEKVRVPEALPFAQKALQLKNEHNRQLKEEKRVQKEKEKAKIAQWVKNHGSKRLQRMVEEDIECEAVYLDERLAIERPDWKWSDKIRGEYCEPRNPPESAFELLDKARGTEPDAVLVYWTVEHEHGEDCYHDDCPKYDWNGYAAVTDFLGREIVFGGPS